MSRNDNKAISTMYAAVGMIVLLVIGFAAGYYMSPGQPEPSQEFPEDSEWRTDTISLAGSTTVLPVAESASIAFMNEYTDATITVSGGGSGTGYSSTIDGIVDIGMASRPPKQAEIDRGVNLWLHPIALDAVCVVVHPSVADSLNLTLQEVGKIFSGEYTHWNEVKNDLDAEEIYVVVRESGSGTRGTFEEYTIDPWDYTIPSAGVHEQPSNPAVRTTIETTSYSIGYVGFGFLSENMVAVALTKEGGSGFIPPTLTNIQGGTYPISRLLYFVTSSQLESGSLADRFLEFVLSTEGQEIVESEGFLKLPVAYNYP